MKQKKYKILSTTFAVCFIGAFVLFAGDLVPSSAPDNSASSMFTVEALYQRLLYGTAGTKRSGGFTEPSSGPTSGTMHNLNDVMLKMPEKDDANGAAVTNVLQGKKFWGLTSGQWGLKEGAMPNIGQQNFTPTTDDQTISQGFHDGTGQVSGDANLVADNIKAGVSIFGVVGKTEVVDTTSGDAASTDIISGKKAWVGGSEVTGSIVTQTLSAASANVPAGFYTATTLTAVDSDLVAGNIRSGINLFGIDGDSNVVDTSSGDAAATEILSGKKAWVGGQEVSGTMTNVGVQNVTPGTTNITISQGYHDGTGQITGDPDLVSGNIRASTNIFGVAGNSNVVDTSSGDAATATIKFGNKAWVDGKEITGFLAGGKACEPAATYSPLKRWCDNGDGTVTDTTTGLIWLKNWGYFSLGTYYQRSVGVSNLTIGTNVNPGTWRLPTRQEFKDICTKGDERIQIGSTYFFTNVPTTNSAANVPYEDADVRFWCCGPVDQVSGFAPDCNTWNLTDQTSDYQACASRTFAVPVLGTRHP